MTVWQRARKVRRGAGTIKRMEEAYEESRRCSERGAPSSGVREAEHRSNDQPGGGPGAPAPPVAQSAAEEVASVAAPCQSGPCPAQ